MISLTLFLSIAAFHQANSVTLNEYGDLNDHSMMKSVRRACREKVHVDEVIFDMAIQKKLNQVADDRALQCYVKCVFQTSNTMDENGKFDLAHFLAGMRTEASNIYNEEVLNCQAEVDDPDHCVKAMKMYQCFKRNTVMISTLYERFSQFLYK